MVQITMLDHPCRTRLPFSLPAITVAWVVAMTLGPLGVDGQEGGQPPAKPSPPSANAEQPESSSRSDPATMDEGTAKEDTQSASAPKVEIEPIAEDDQIARRLTDILEATTWFENPVVRVDQGVVFQRGLTHQADYRTWAGDLARNTQDVVAVVNRIEVTERSMWDMTPAWSELRKLGREAIQMLPLLGLAVVLLIATWFAAGWSTWLARSLLKRRVKNSLLIGVFSRAVAIPVFLLGLYLALRVSGLTQMAATVLGGTGLIGLFLGIAFRDIAENFLASILISIQRPFALGDLIEVEELGASTVNLRVYFWINAHVHSKLKVRSSIIRLTKLAIEDAGMSMPDESR